jgi:glycosyltransferase involved in cell wall biosynthesis
MVSVVIVTNIPAPYREPIHEKVSSFFKGNYTVVYCSKLEPNRQWKFKYGNYNKVFLTETSNGYIHNNPKIWKELNRLRPDVVITTAFNPTMLYSFFWAVLNKRPHITFTDGTYTSEQFLSIKHRIIRKIVYLKTRAFIGPGRGSADLYRSYKIPEEKIFRSPLCVNNGLFSARVEKKYDLMFSGQLIEGKLPFFFVEVARRVKEKLGSCRVLIIGSGVLKEEVVDLLKKYELDYEYPGFVHQEFLPEFYSKSRLLLFPSKNDTWGVVANEAMAAGVPVITCAASGVADDLVLHSKNGYVLPISVEDWAEHVVKLLTCKELYDGFSKACIEHVQSYNFDEAAIGIIKAVEFARIEK